MNSVSFYKPNSKNTGSAAQFNYGLKSGDFSLYISIIKQASWDDQTKRGSFTENAKNPDKNKTVKLNITEAAAIIRVISEESNKWTTVHKTSTAITSLTFSPYIKDGTKLGYGFSISEKDKNSFMLSLTSDEGKVLEIFLTKYITDSFLMEGFIKKTDSLQEDTISF